MLRHYSLCNVRAGPTLHRQIFKNPQIIVEIIIRASVRPFFCHGVPRTAGLQVCWSLSHLCWGEAGGDTHLTGLTVHPRGNAENHPRSTPTAQSAWRACLWTVGGGGSADTDSRANMQTVQTRNLPTVRPQCQPPPPRSSPR